MASLFDHFQPSLDYVHTQQTLGVGQRGPCERIYYETICSRVFHITPFFLLSLVLLTTHAIGLYEVTKKFQRYRQ